MMNMIKRLSGVLLALCLVAPMLSAQSEGKQSTHLWSYSEPVMKYIAYSSAFYTAGGDSRERAEEYRDH